MRHTRLAHTGTSRRSRFERIVALVTAFFLLVFVNPAIAHGANGSVGAPGAGPHHYGHNFNHVSFNPFTASALTPGANTHVPGTSAGLGSPRHTYQLDLTSSASNIILGSKLFHGAPSVTIDVGGQSKTFSAGSPATAAEFVAVQQV